MVGVMLTGGVGGCVLCVGRPIAEHVELSRALLEVEPIVAADTVIRGGTRSARPTMADDPGAVSGRASEVVEGAVTR